MKEREGLHLPRHVPPLQAGSSIERPAVIQANLRPNSLINIGAFTGLYGGNSVVHSCSIGRFCSFADGVIIGPSEHPISWLSTSMIQYVENVHDWGTFLENNGMRYSSPMKRFRASSTVQIGNDVWVGTRVFIRSGVTIGDGAVIAAHSVVLEDVPPYAVVGGVPSRIIKYRFSEDVIARLISVEWWRYNIMSVSNIDFSDVYSCLDKLECLIEKSDIEELKVEKYYFGD